MSLPIVTFCGCAKIVQICGCLPCFPACSPLPICAQIHLYSHWKQAIIDGCLSAGFTKAFDTVGGNPVSATCNLSGYYFLTNGWRVRPREQDESYVVEGNLFTCGGVCHPFVNTVCPYNTFVTINTSAQSLTSTAASIPAPCIATLADAVWDETLACHVACGSTGAKLDTLPTSGTGDWTAGEKENIRAALGVTGTKTAGSGGTLQSMFKKIKLMLTLLFTK